MPIPKIETLREELSKTIIGQDELVKAVSICIYRHLLKIIGVQRGKLTNSVNNLLVIGDTGTGKSLTVQRCAQLTNLPFVEINSKRITQEGWAGKSFIELLEEGFREIQHSSSRYHPIIFLDEFDKVIVPNIVSKNDDVNRHIQASILKVIEGTEICINKVTYNTSNFCFVFAGAFVDLFKPKANISGFGDLQSAEKEDITKKLIDYGMMPELAGRITRQVVTNPFTSEMYRDLICNKNSIFNQWFALFRELGVEITKQPNYTLIIEEAVKKKLGARGLIQLMEPEIDRLMEENLDKLDVSVQWNSLNNFNILMGPDHV